MKQTDWKIVYTRYEGVIKKAVNLLSREAGALLIREQGVYTIYVLPCEKEGCEIPKNAFVVGCYAESETVRRFVAKEEIPEEGFLIKVIDNPNDPESRIIILTAHTECELFYAAVSFIDDYIPANAPNNGANRMPDRFFDKPIAKGSYTERPDHKTRSIFTWGHSINDYRAYIDNMARVKLNELIIWNDYVPLNIKDIIEYAHSYGIKIILGYSWGWKEISGRATEFTDDAVNSVKDLVVKEYIEHYEKSGCDGIYFQSITERQEEEVGGKYVSSVVTDMVNDIAARLWEITPDLRLLFGLHATSVRSRLDDIARVDPRIEILWEDCGAFPYAYGTSLGSDEKYKETLEFTKRLLQLRGGQGVGLVFKGVMMLDWTRFFYQHGPYVMGENSSAVADHDRRLRCDCWKLYSSEWTRVGERAQDMLRFIADNKLGEVHMCIAGTFDGGIYLPFALCAQMFRTLGTDYSQTLCAVSRRGCVSMG